MQDSIIYLTSLSVVFLVLMECFLIQFPLDQVLETCTIKANLTCCLFVVLETQPLMLSRMHSLLGQYVINIITIYDLFLASLLRPPPHNWSMTIMNYSHKDWQPKRNEIIMLTQAWGQNRLLRHLFAPAETYYVSSTDPDPDELRSPICIVCNCTARAAPDHLQDEGTHIFNYFEILVSYPTTRVLFILASKHITLMPQ